MPLTIHLILLSFYQLHSLAISRFRIYRDRIGIDSITIARDWTTKYCRYYCSQPLKDSMRSESLAISHFTQAQAQKNTKNWTVWKVKTSQKVKLKSGKSNTLGSMSNLRKQFVKILRTSFYWKTALISCVSYITPLLKQNFVEINLYYWNLALILFHKRKLKLECYAKNSWQELIVQAR